MVVMARRSDPRVLPGTLITLRRKCGKANCRCVHGDPHETPALSYSVGGRSKLLTLRSDEVPVVKAAVDRYRRQIGELEAAGRAELDAFVAQVRANRETPK